jgi:peptidoglycan hydrolase-like protein with peptidoglycan-binding domain
MTSKTIAIHIGVVFILMMTSAVTVLAYDKMLQQAQKKLIDLGYGPGSADGIYGKKTNQAIKKFQ